MKLWHIPIRATAGLFLLHTASTKWPVDEKGAAPYHALAVCGYPFLKSVPPRTFVRSMAGFERGVAGLLLLPFVPSALGGFGIGALGSALLGVYLRSPGMRRSGSLRPTAQGLTVAKDSWLAAMGAALVLDALSDRGRAARPASKRPLSQRPLR